MPPILPFFSFVCAILRVENDRKIMSNFFTQFAQHSSQKNTKTSKGRRLQTKKQLILLFFLTQIRTLSLSIQQRNTGTCEVRESMQRSVRNSNNAALSVYRAHFGWNTNRRQKHPLYYTDISNSHWKSKLNVCTILFSSRNK